MPCPDAARPAAIATCSVRDPTEGPRAARRTITPRPHPAPSCRPPDPSRPCTTDPGELEGSTPSVNRGARRGAGGMPMTVVVTAAAGPLGRAILERLLAHGTEPSLLVATDR